jgi:hypothetical protein
MSCVCMVRARRYAFWGRVALIYIGSYGPGGWVARRTGRWAEWALGRAVYLSLAWNSAHFCCWLHMFLSSFNVSGSYIDPYLSLSPLSPYICICICLYMYIYIYIQCFDIYCTCYNHLCMGPYRTYGPLVPWDPWVPWVSWVYIYTNVYIYIYMYMYFLALGTDQSTFFPP